MARAEPYSAPQRRIDAVIGHLAPAPTSAGADASEDLRYTLPDPILTPEQRLQYERDGFLVIPNLVPEDAIDRYHQRFVDICEGRVEPEITMIIMKDVAVAKEGPGVREGAGERRINKIQDFQDDAVFFDYCRRPEILQYVRAFTGPDIKSVHSMLISKPPDAGEGTSRHPLHQDLHYFPFRPADRIVASWTAMERITRENGCLVVLPGSHRDPGRLLRHDYPEWEGGVNKMYHGVRDYDQSQPLTYLHMNKGDTVFFHPLLIHGSGRNRTSGFRKAISCHYASSQCDYIDVRGTTQETIADEVAEIGRRKFGIELEFADVWRVKSRLVAGRPGPL